jgi:methyl-accepting chemotaxis protein
MKKEKSRRQLRHLLIRKEIQLALVLLNLLFSVTASVAIILLVLTPIYEGIQSSDNVGAQNVLARMYLLISDRLLVTLVAICVLGVIYTLIISHRFCGPLENFCHTFRRISHGDLTRKVFLRRNDFLKYEAGQVNDMIDHLSLRLDSISRQHRIIKSKVEALSSAQSQRPETRQAFSELASAVDGCLKTVDEVKILVKPASPL